VLHPVKGAGTDAVEIIVVAGLGGVFVGAVAALECALEIGVELDGRESESPVDTGLAALLQATD
jgi:hypothetical protein